MVKKRTAAISANQKLNTAVTDLGMSDRQGDLGKPGKGRNWLKIGIIVLAIIGVLFVISRNKSRLLAATVNGVPISRFELSQRLTDRFGQQMLEAMIGETLIMEEARKQNVIATPQEVAAKVSDIEKSLKGSMTLNDSLKMQGITRPEFESQVRIQLMIDKMFTKDTTVSTAEVDDFIKKNAGQLTATTDAERKTEAERQIHNDKLGKVFTDWFTKLKDQAKVTRYL